MSFIGVDIGGTNVRVGLVDNLKIRKLKSFRTPKELKAFLSNLLFEIDNVVGSEVEGIGIGIPGVVDPFKRKILSCPNISFLDNFPLAELIEKRFKKEVFIENDVNIAALVEMYTREEKYKNIITLYIGTGIGGAIIIERKLYQGSRGGVMEIGHIIVKKDGPLCVCGNKGCIETFVSGFGLSRMWEEFFREKLRGEEIFELYRRGNNKANKVVTQFLSYLNILILNLANIFSSDIIVIGGGIKEEIRPFINEIKNWGRNYKYNPFPIEISNLSKPGVIRSSLLPIHLHMY